MKNGEDFFRIDPSTGDVYLLKPLYQSVKSSHAFNVVLTDDGGRSVTRTVTINVQRLDSSTDSCINFSLKNTTSHIVNVPENKASGVIFQLFAGMFGLVFC